MVACAGDCDGDVVDLARRGDVKAALSRLMQRHGVRIYHYCSAALRDTALADDVHQLIFIQAFRDLPRFQGRSTIRTWLFGIARHRVLDAARARCRTRRRAWLPQHNTPPDPPPPVGESIDDLRLREALVLSLERLDDKARTALLLHYQQGLTFEEIAVICREKAGTLAARVARALPRLRADIESRVRSPPERVYRGRRALPVGV
jgi:RNA polymerase sigma-70 factor (ECF subfamily)